MIYRRGIMFELQTKKRDFFNNNYVVGSCRLAYYILTFPFRGHLIVLDSIRFSQIPIHKSSIIRRHKMGKSRTKRNTLHYTDHLHIYSVYYLYLDYNPSLVTRVRQARKFETMQLPIFLFLP